MASSSYGRMARQLSISTQDLADAAAPVEIKPNKTDVQVCDIRFILSERQETKTTHSWELVVINKNKQETTSLEYSEDKSVKYTLEKRLKGMYWTHVLAEHAKEPLMMLIDKLLEMGKPVEDRVDANKVILNKIALWVIEGRLTELEYQSNTAVGDVVPTNLAQIITHLKGLQQKASTQVAKNQPKIEDLYAATICMSMCI